MGNSNIVANGKNQLTLTCTTGVSYPVSDIRWYKGSTVTASTGISFDQPSDYGDIIRARTWSLQPTWEDDGKNITCEA